MKKIIVSLVLAAFLAACSQGVIDEEKSESAPAKKSESAATNPHTDGSIPLDNEGKAMQQKPVQKERQYAVPKEVAEKYKSLIIEVKNIPENSSVQTDVLIGQKSEVTGTPFEVLVEYYFPDFVIDADGTITTRSAEENNPVAKIKVFKFGEVFFDGWLFKNHPDEHGNFADKAYSMTLVKSVTK